MLSGSGYGHHIEQFEIPAIQPIDQGISGILWFVQPGVEFFLCLVQYIIDGGDANFRETSVILFSNEIKLIFKVPEFVVDRCGFRR